MTRLVLGLLLASTLLATGTPPSAPASPNLAVIGAPAVWEQGFTGQGVVVALLDTGVDLYHPELAARWRGGAHAWFDPYGEHPEGPLDLDGHGTQMLGIILAGEASGTQIGVAPGAQWIAARIFNDRGRATTEAIHAALRWVLDPDGDPSTPDAPQVLNASWSAVDVTCNPEFAPDLRALRAAGILPVFAAGLDLPFSPANLSEAFAVGALADATTLAADSPHGPSPCLPNSPFPQLVAPGVDILTTDRGGAYTTGAGTSLAAAHVSGALALLLSARPGLTADEQAALLMDTAIDLGPPGPDHEFGHGRLAVNRAVARARAVAASPMITLYLSVALGLALVLAWGWARRSNA